jgi:hypothetical protein
MPNNISQKKLDELLGYVVNETPGDVRDLLRQNGYTGVDDLKGNDLSIAFLKAIKDNGVFRNEVADYLTGMVQHETSNGRMNFVSSKSAGSNFNAVTGGMSDFSAYGGSSDASTSSTTTPAPSTGGSFWSNLGSSQNINTVLSSGLNVLSTSLVNKSNKASEERALQAKALDLQIAQTNAAAKTQAASSGKGMPGWGWALIGLAVVGGIVAIVLVKRKKSKAA